MKKKWLGMLLLVVLLLNTIGFTFAGEIDFPEPKMWSPIEIMDIQETENL